jgi:hypothetical protein
MYCKSWKEKESIIEHKLLCINANKTFFIINECLNKSIKKKNK